MNLKCSQYDLDFKRKENGEDVSVEIDGILQCWKTVVLVRDFLWAFCNLILIFVIYFERHWTEQHLVIGALGLLGLSFFLVLPESPRWLANNGHKEDAKEILLNISKGNKRQVSLQQR